MNISGIIYDSVVDGKGLRNTIFISGCEHYCTGCHNSETWSKDYGEIFTLEKQINFIENCKKNILLSGITISGGDPLYAYINELLEFIKLYKEKLPEHNIWLYTGYVFENLTDVQKKVLPYIDVLIDGKFEQEKKDITLKFKGSSNQRIIDVKQTLKENKIILYKLGD